MHLPLTLVVEGQTDVLVLRRVVTEVGLCAGTEYITAGKTALDRRLDGFNRAARSSPWLVLRDLNGDEECAPALVARLLPHPQPAMRLHVAERAVEAWLIADAGAIAGFLAVPTGLVPRDPEGLVSPKKCLVDMARRSRSRRIRDALVPAAATTAVVGPGYSATVAEYVLGTWRPRVAAGASPSLACLLGYLDTLGRPK